MGLSLDFQGSNAVAETSAGDRVTGISETGADLARDGMCKAKQEALDPDEGRASILTGYMADRASGGPEKAEEMANRVGETAKKTMDGAWKTARETTEEIKEAAAGERNVGDLRRRAGGYDKAE